MIYWVFKFTLLAAPLGLFSISERSVHEGSGTVDPVQLSLGSSARASSKSCCSRASSGATASARCSHTVAVASGVGEAP